MAQKVKTLPAMPETWVLSLGGENPLEEGLATHSSILAGEIPMDRGAWQDTVRGCAKSRIKEWGRASPFFISAHQFYPTMNGWAKSFLIAPSLWEDKEGKQ